MGLTSYLNIVESLIGKENNPTRREVLIRYRHYVELAIQEERAVS